MVCKYFLPVYSLQFHPLKKVFHGENFHKVQCIKLSLLFVSCLIALVYTYPHFSSFRKSLLPLPPKNLVLSVWFGGWKAKRVCLPGRVIGSGMVRSPKGDHSEATLRLSKSIGKDVLPFSTWRETSWEDEQSQAVERKMVSVMACELNPGMSEAHSRLMLPLWEPPNPLLFFSPLQGA